MTLLRLRFSEVNIRALLMKSRDFYPKTNARVTSSEHRYEMEHLLQIDEKLVFFYFKSAQQTSVHTFRHELARGGEQVLCPTEIVVELPMHLRHFT